MNILIKKILFKLLFFTPFLITPIIMLGQEKVFKAGASTTNITPHLGAKVVGNFYVPTVDYIHDELHVRTLALNDGEQILTFSIIDNVGVPERVLNAAKKSIHKILGIPYKNMLMASVHDHSAASARERSYYGTFFDDYQNFLIKRIVDGVQIALKNLQPAKIGWGGADVPEHVFTRRYFMKDSIMSPMGVKDIVEMNPGIGNPEVLKPNGVTDPEVSFLAVKSLNDRPIALLANYSLHYVGGVPDNQISADYFGAFADQIQKLLGADRQHPPFVGIMSNGTSGNVNNIDVLTGDSAKLYPGGTDLWTVLDIHDNNNVNLGETGGAIRPPYQQIHKVANDVAEKVLKVYKTLRFKNWVPLDASLTKLKVKLRKPSQELIANMKRVFNRPKNADPLFHPYERIFLGRVKAFIEDGPHPDSIDVPVQTFKIGDLGIAAAPFEVFAKTGLEIKKKSPFKKTFTIELANGSYGYLPTPDQFKYGGYETWFGSNHVGAQTSARLVQRIISQFTEIIN